MSDGVTTRDAYASKKSEKGRWAGSVAGYEGRLGHLLLFLKRKIKVIFHLKKIEVIFHMKKLMSSSI